ncbi:glycoside hydrolase family 16 protein [Flavobacterium sp. LPB0248]|uniref:glycoside hydrolase family 16 protein n=1 Tax=Flavobacterium sp. LPB0248 TaxID=2614441 RepID=UPI0015A5F86A|nr:glycoside hydrolase family 16 protein [Flavobacterium sp. LPB0248]QLC64782.1 glycoside hydrolase family 16 protein [Flavobacterium sp. LPB0248]
MKKTARLALWALTFFFAAKTHSQHDSIRSFDSMPIDHAAKARAYQLLFEDNFSKAGKISKKDWLYRSNVKMGGMSLPENVLQGKAVDGSAKDCLLIRFTYDGSRPEGQQYLGGGVVSTHNFGYGYYEARVKLYGGNKEMAGLHQSFWSMGLTGTNEAEGKGVRDRLVEKGVIPKENRVLEVDGFEHNSISDKLAQNYHIYTPTHKSEAPTPESINRDLSQWITVAYEWLPDRINFYCDGKYISTKYLDGIWKVYAPQNLWLTALPVDVAGWGGLKKPLKNAAMQVDYVRFYGKVLPGVNRIGNACFDYAKAGNAYPTAWIVDPRSDSSAVGVVPEGIPLKSGKGYLFFKADKTYSASVRQSVEFIPDGSYTFGAWVKSSGGQKDASISVKSGNRKQVVPLRDSASWVKVIIPKVKVSNNQAVIEISCKGRAGQWLIVDNVSFAND